MWRRVILSVLTFGVLFGLANATSTEAEIGGLLRATRRVDDALLGGSGCTIQSIACGQTRTARISASDCFTKSGVFTDFYAFNGVAGQTVTINMSSVDFDPFLLLFDPEPEIVATDDNSGPGNSARIVFTLNQTSPDWVISATPFEPFVFGDYIVSLACVGSNPMPPAAPSDLTGQATSPTSVLLQWQDNSGNETSFRVERRLFGTGSYLEIGSTAANATQFQDATASPETAYEYRVRARNAAGNSPYSNVVNVITPPSQPSGPCIEDDHTLCLLDGRFRVQVQFTRPQTGVTEPANAIPFTDRAGMFWFFNAENIEMLFKMQDACGTQVPRFWVFYAATTNVAFNVLVTDTQTDVGKPYSNPAGTQAPPVADTGAFATCP